MNASGFFNTFQFQYQTVFNKNVHPVSTIQFDALVFHRNRMLKFELNSMHFQFMRETLFMR